MTLVEILIVIVIIGILAALMIPNLMSSRDRAQDVSVKSFLRSVTIKQVDYQMENSSYANDISLLQDLTLQRGVLIESWQADASNFCIQAKQASGESYKVSSNGIVQQGTC